MWCEVKLPIHPILRFFEKINKLPILTASRLATCCQGADSTTCQSSPRSHNFANFRGVISPAASMTNRSPRYRRSGCAQARCAPDDRGSGSLLPRAGYLPGIGGWSAAVVLLRGFGRSTYFRQAAAKGWVWRSDPTKIRPPNICRYRALFGKARYQEACLDRL